MANPNIVNVSSVLGKLATLDVDSDLTNIIACSANQILKINTLMVANRDSADRTGSITAFINKNTGTDVYIADQVSVPDASSLVLISKDNSIYLEESDALQLKANTSGFIHAVCSYEIITDA